MTSKILLNLFWGTILILSTSWIGVNPNKNSGNFTVYCQGQCSDKGCGLTGVLGTKDDYVQSSSNNCSMVVVQEKNGQKIKSKDKLPSEFKGFTSEVSAFLKYIETKYKTTDYIITSIEVNSDENSQVTLFNYEIAGKQKGSVMYAKIRTGPITQIDCNATKFDCREKWVFGSTPHAECTCQEDCKMSITEIKDK